MCPYCGRKEEDMRGSIAARRGRDEALREVLHLVEELRDKALHEADLFGGVKKVGINHEITAYARIIKAIKTILGEDTG
jgi:hypothetical protein